MQNMGQLLVVQPDFSIIGCLAPAHQILVVASCLFENQQTALQMSKILPEGGTPLLITMIIEVEDKK